MRLIAGIFMSVMSLSFAANSAEVKALHVDWLDKQVSPAQNFFSFANGGWQKKHPIPAAYASWGTLHMLDVQNEQRIHELIEKLVGNKAVQADSDEQKIRDFYVSGMDEKAIAKAGATPLQPEFERINHIKNTSDLQATITHLQMIGVGDPFQFGQMQDFMDSSKVIGVACQSGLGLPDRDYYLRSEKNFLHFRQLYQLHVAKMFELLGDSKEKAAAEAKTVMAVETALAKASMTRIQQRDPHATYHVMDLKELQTLMPQFAWQQYFTDIGHPEIKQINVAMPDFFKALNTQFTSLPLDDWKIYLRWHVINSFASALSPAFENEDFHFVSALTGAKTLLPRWQRIVNAEDQAMGFAVGKLYVQRYFSPESKQKAQVILNNIRQALKADLQQLSWMTPETRAAAITKLDKMKDRIGYPDKWRDYSALHIDQGPYALNVMRTVTFLYRYELDKIGKPVNRDEWDMTPQTVNAYYDPSMNMLTIPAGILQPPFFDPNATAAVNYGAIGSVMGHEMTHGFDDEGAQFDSNGELKNWWTPTDLKKFQAATQCIADQFSQYTVAGDAHVQGPLVVGEATADLGGLILAYKAFHASESYKNAKPIAGFTPDQQFFLGAAHVWAMNILPQEARRLVITNPHAPAIYRVNGTLSNMPQFQQAYGIHHGMPMVNPHQCVIW